MQTIGAVGPRQRERTTRAKIVSPPIPSRGVYRYAMGNSTVADLAIAARAWSA